MKKILSILLILAMALSFTVMAFAEEKKDDPDLKTFLSELAEKDKVTEEDLSELLTILGNRIAEEIGTGLSDAAAWRIPAPSLSTLSAIRTSPISRWKTGQS